MRPEVELILCCAQASLSEGQVARVRGLVQQPLEWNFVVELINRHTLHPLVYRNVRRYCAEQTPNYLLAQLKAWHEQSAIANLLRLSQLVELIDLLQAEGIGVIPYKGPVLAQQLYGDTALRLFGDLDILVPLADVARAQELLQAAGFVQSWPAAALSPAQAASHLRTKYNYQYKRAVDDLVIELHWGITPNYLNCPPQHAWLWERLTPFAVAGRTVTVFPPEELLLTLCLHAGNHCWLKLSWVADIAQLLVRYPALDWGYLLALAQRWHSQRLLQLGLYLAHTLLEAALPPDVEQWIKSDPAVVALAHQTGQRLFHRVYQPLRLFAAPCYHLRLRERWQDRLHYGVAMLTPTPADLTFLPLPPRLAALYYLTRPLRLVYEQINKGFATSG